MKKHPLRKFREENGYGLEALGELVGVNASTLHRIEKGVQYPRMKLLARLIDVSGGKLKADDFLPKQAA